MSDIELGELTTTQLQEIQNNTLLSKSIYTYLRKLAQDTPGEFGADLGLILDIALELDARQGAEA